MTLSKKLSFDKNRVSKEESLLGKLLYKHIFRETREECLKNIVNTTVCGLCLRYTALSTCFQLVIPNTPDLTCTVQAHW